MNPIDTVDRVSYMRFAAMMMSPEELLQLFSPQIICVSDPELNEQEFPALEVLERNSLRPDMIYMLFNSYSICLFVGRQTDPWFIEEIFKVPNFQNIDKSISEDEMFANAAESKYLTALAGIINQIRFMRQPFCELVVLLNGEVESEQTVCQMCITDEGSNPRYRIDYNKFMQRIQQAANQPGAGVPVVQQATTTGVTGGTTPAAGYY